MDGTRYFAKLHNALATSCLAVAFASVPVSAQPATGEKLTAEDANPTGGMTFG